MKAILAAAAISISFLSACNSNTETAEHKEPAKESSAAAGTAAPESKPVAGSAEIVTAYIQLKNALVADNANDAASAGTALTTAFSKFDKSALTADQKKTYEELEADAKEHAEHISKNGSNIKHQREHFEELSQDIRQLATSFPSGQTLYVTHCPMYNNNKGADWLSESKEIKNPYFGKNMLTCGSVKSEIR